jgi:NAD-dependent SIR2 family protein deacetylase
MSNNIEAAVKLITNADAILIGAGAGMGVDSGFPDFRGDKGFWKAYPQLKDLGKSFEEMANGDFFFDNPELAWWFYGHRFKLYRNAQPHEGYNLLKKLSLNKSTFVFTSNVDGHFQKAGFKKNQILEWHGRINYLQCSYGCSDSIWEITSLSFTVNDQDLSIEGRYPCCPNCGGIARPNILMFNDQWWLSGRTRQQEKRFHAWLDEHWGKNIISIELGAGTAIPSVRIACSNNSKNLIRINPIDYSVSKGQIPIKMSALSALIEINKLLFI